MTRASRPPVRRRPGTGEAHRGGVHPRLLGRRRPDAARGDGLVVIWVLVRQCDWQSSELEQINCANDTRRPLNSLTEADLDEALLSVARQVRLALS